MKINRITSIICAVAAVVSLVSCSSGSKLPYGKYNLSDYIDPGDYKNVTVTEEAIDSEMTTQINTMLSANTVTTVITDRGVKDGDVVNIDYSGYMDGELFPNGSDTGFDLTIGSSQFIPGFEDGLIGAKTGETVEINIFFPDEYKLNPDYAGKPVMFKVKINQIAVKTVPELTDELIATVYPNYPTVATYKDALRENVKMSLLWDAIVEKATVIKYPEDEVDVYYSNMINQFTNTAETNSMSLEDLMTNYYQMSLDDFYAQATQYAQSQVASEMVAYAIAEKEDIMPNDTQYQETALQLAISNGVSTVADLEKKYGADMVMTSVVRKLVVDHLIDVSETAIVTAE